MRSTKVSRWIRGSMLLLPLAFAGCTTVSAEGPPQRLCSRYVDLFLERTEHAPPPGTSQAAHGAFEIAEAGQLELSNHDKDLAKQVLHICEQEGADAEARGKRALKPWYKRIFGEEQRKKGPAATPAPKEFAQA